MATRNPNSTPNSDNEPSDEEEENRRLASNEKITLTSRRTKKHVTIYEQSSSQSLNICDVEVAIKGLEDHFVVGIEEIRKCLISLTSTSKSYELRIKSMEESLRKSSAEKEKYICHMELMKADIETLTAKLVTVQEENASLLRDNQRLQSNQEDIRTLTTKLTASEEENASLQYHNKRLQSNQEDVRTLTTKLTASEEENASLQHHNKKLQSNQEDIITYKEKLAVSEEEKASLYRDNQNLQSDHECHLNSIARKYRQKQITKKTVNKWRGKLKKKEMSRSQIVQLMKENEKLKAELILHQETSKNALLRSATMLNSEVTNLFQATSNRRSKVETTETCTSDSEASSISTRHSQVYEGKERMYNKRRYKQGFAERVDRSEGKGETYSDQEVYQSGKYRSKHKAYVGGNSPPDPLRRETRQIMKQLDVNSRSLSDSDARKRGTEVCHSQAHVHICHCVPLSGKAGSCPYCDASQNYNFANIPLSTKTNPIPKAKCNQSRAQQNSYELFSTERNFTKCKPIVIRKH